MQELLDTIEQQLNNFRGNYKETTKASHRRARKASLALTKLFKQYRAATIEADKK